jgi:hypothetical protein
MADRKISELTSYPAPSPSDIIPIVQVSAGVTKKITIQDLLQDRPLVTVGFSNADYICDGVADNVQMQEAIDYLVAQGGGVLHIKKGNYANIAAVTVSSAGDVPISIQGEGAASKISLTGNISFFTHVGDENGSFVRNIYIDCNDSTGTAISYGGAGVGAGQHKNTILENVTIIDCGGNAFYHDGLNFEVRNCNFLNVFSGIQSNTVTSGAERSCIITGNRITCVTYADAETEGMDLNWHGSASSYAIISDNYISGFRKDGIDANVNYATITGNIVIQPDYDSVSPDTSSILLNITEATANGVIANNVVLNVSGQGIVYPNDATISITGNFVEGATVQDRGYGIRLTGAGTPTVVGNTFKGLKVGISNEMTGTPVFTHLLNKYVSCIATVSGNAVSQVTEQLYFSSRCDFRNDTSSTGISAVFGIAGTYKGIQRFDSDDSGQPALFVRGFASTGIASIDTASGSTKTLRFSNTSSGSFILDVTGQVTENTKRLTSITTGTAIPAVTPGKVGDIFVDTTNKSLYIAEATSSSADWRNVRHPRTGTVADSAAPTPNIDAQDVFTVTALAQAAEFGIPTGTPVNGQKLIIRIKDDGTARALTWNAIYRTIGVLLPSTTVLSKTHYVGCVYNSTDTKWDVLAVGQEA